jgi:hypothetical protein
MPCITTKEVERGLAELEDIGVLTRDDDGALRFTSWDRRSGHAKPSDEPDAVRQRVAKHRARRKHGDVTPRNASDVTPGNGGELELEIEQEIEQEREQDGNAAHTRDGDSIAAEKTLAESLRNTAGDHWPDVRRFLESRKRETRPAWIREMAKLIGPGSQFSSADLAGACADALALEEPLSGPHALRAFIAKCALERTSATTAAAIGGPGRGHNAHESIQLVGQIKRLIRRQGASRFIPRNEVEKMGARVIHAYDAVGGADRFLSTDPNDVKFLPHAFKRALDAADSDDAPGAVA